MSIIWRISLNIYKDLSSLDKFQDNYITIQLLTNLSCNLNCSYCYEHNKTGRVLKEEEAINFLSKSFPEGQDLIGSHVFK